MTLRRVAIPSPNYSSRGGVAARLIVLHTAEGARTYTDLGHYFQGDVGVSSHVGIDDTANTVGEYVRPEYKAWTQANANPVAVSAELCAFAAWSPAEWDRHPNMLANAAAWVAEEAARFRIPLTRLSAAQAQGGGHGVCQHIDLGAWGGGHVDCGPHFPMDRVMIMAGSSGPAPEPEPEEDQKMLATFTWAGGIYVTDGLYYRWVVDEWDLKALRIIDPKIKDLGAINGLQGMGVPADETTAYLSGQEWPFKRPAGTG